MTSETATPPGAISENTVSNSLTALRARLRETPETSLITRPLHRSQVVELYRIVLAYQALTRRENEST
jgi:hypothetical protein